MSRSQLKRWLADIGAKGGRSKSPAKVAAARETLAVARLHRWPGKRPVRGVVVGLGSIRDAAAKAR